MQPDKVFGIGVGLTTFLRGAGEFRSWRGKKRGFFAGIFYFAQNPVAWWSRSFSLVHELIAFMAHEPMLLANTAECIS